MQLTPKNAETFDDKWEVEPNSGCWLWTGSMGLAGYGRIKNAGRTMMAHRIMYTRMKGAIPRGLHLDHLCRTPLCINPDHLEPVTPSENVKRGACVQKHLKCSAIHIKRRPRLNCDKERFFQYVKKLESGCWEWTGSISHGYGCFRYHNRAQRAHRVAYMLLVGPIPEGLALDHLCCNRKCVNPEHLEPVTLFENSRRADTWRRAAEKRRQRTHCRRGHEYTKENTYIQSKGGRGCRKCRLITKRAWREPQKKGLDLSGLALGAAASVAARKARKACKNGHEWTPKNTLVNKLGHRSCRACHAARERRRREAKRKERISDYGTVEW